MSKVGASQPKLVFIPISTTNVSTFKTRANPSKPLKDANQADTFSAGSALRFLMGFHVTISREPGRYLLSRTRPIPSAFTIRFSWLDRSNIWFCFLLTYRSQGIDTVWILTALKRKMENLDWLKFPWTRISLLIITWNPIRNRGADPAEKVSAWSCWEGIGLVPC